MNKACATCKQVKHVSEFGKQKQKHDGLRCYCKSCDNERRRKWSLANKDKQKAIVSRHRSTAEYKETARQYQRQRRKDPTQQYKQNLSRRIRTALERMRLGSKTKRTMEIVGCSVEYLAAHLMQTAIDRYGYWLATEPYHIDHITPLATANTVEEVDRLNHYTNLQLLTPADNLAKSDRV